MLLLELVCSPGLQQVQQQQVQPRHGSQPRLPEDVSERRGIGQRAARAHGVDDGRQRTRLPRLYKGGSAKNVCGGSGGEGGVSQLLLLQGGCQANGGRCSQARRDIVLCSTVKCSAMESSELAVQCGAHLPENPKCAIEITGGMHCRATCLAGNQVLEYT